MPEKYAGATSFFRFALCCNKYKNEPLATALACTAHLHLAHHKIPTHTEDIMTGHHFLQTILSETHGKAHK